LGIKKTIAQEIPNIFVGELIWLGGSQGFSHSEATSHVEVMRLWIDSLVKPLASRLTNEKNHEKKFTQGSRKVPS